MIDRKIAIIGAGHIGKALVRGLLLGRAINGQFLTLANPHLDKLQKFNKEYKAQLTSSNIEATKFCGILIIAVKPKIVLEVIREIRKYIQRETLIISAAACVPIRLLEIYLGSNRFKIVRIMPNIAVSEGHGIIGWLVNKSVNLNDRKMIQKLLSYLGIPIECKDDNQLNKLSLISGCGPGYVGYFMKCLQDKAMQYGFSESDAYRMVLSTFSGTVHNLETINISFQDLVKSIATKGGITEEVLKNLDCNKFPKIFSKSIDRGYDKIKNIEKVLEGMK